LLICLSKLDRGVVLLFDPSFLVIVLQFFRFTFLLDFFFQTTSHVKASNPFECAEEWHIGAQSVGEQPYLEKL
jgi:hypothetical protein